MVRVLHIVTNMDRGGLETMLMNYYRHMDREKIQFDFLEHRRDRAAYDDEIESLGGRIFRLPRLNPLSSDYFHALNAFFAAHPEYRIVHSHLDCMSAYPLCAAKNAKVPVRIAHAHSTSQDRNWKLVFKLISKKLISLYTTDLFACSADAGEWMFGTKDVHILPNAIDIERYAFNLLIRNQTKKALGLDDAFVIGHVGRFSAVKNHSFLTDVFAQIKRQEPNSKLLLVGAGSEMQAVQQKVKALGLGADVIFTGVRNDVANLMQAMDVFVFPSLYEGLGIVLIEAQAAGLPCVVSDTIPQEAYLTDLVTAEKLSSSVEKWAEKILKKRDFPRTDRRDEIAAHGFDITTEAVKLQEFYINAYEQNC